MSSRLVFLDTETTGLDPQTERVFEIAVITEEGDEYVWRLEPPWAVVTRIHPKALEVNRFHERTSGWVWDDRLAALDALDELLHGAHIVGAVPWFDTAFLTEEYRRWELEPPRWHYHLIDIENMAVGWIHRRALENAIRYGGTQDSWTPSVAKTLPWESDELARACGVEPPYEEERHTALGDARAVKRWYERLTNADV